MSALSDDRPQFERLDGDARAAAAEEYRRVWGEEMPVREPDVPAASQEEIQQGPAGSRESAATR